MGEENKIEPRDINDLYAAFATADNILLKKYISDLSLSGCIEPNEEFKKIGIGDNVALYQIAKIVYDKNENVQDKLTTVYSTVFSMQNCGIVLLIEGKKDKTNLYLGVVSRNLKGYKGEDTPDQIEFYKADDVAKKASALKNCFLGNFPGSSLKPVNNKSKSINGQYCIGKNDLIEQLFKKAKYISAVSSIPALRNDKEHKSIEFIQGLEKLIDTMRGKEYSAIIIADAMDNNKIESICAQYEDIYSQLVPFKSSTQTLSTTEGKTETESLITGVTNTTNETISKSLTHGTANSKTHTDTVGVSSGAFGVGANYNHAYSRTKTETEAHTDTKATGTARSLTEQNSVAKSLSSTNGKSVQVNYENRAVKTLLDRIDEQIKRMRSCEDFGMFDTCVYFVSNEYDTVVSAASTFKSITRGENSSVESSAINVWQDENVEYIKEYLMRFYHPEFVPSIFLVEPKVNENKNNDNSSEDTTQEYGNYFANNHVTVTPALMISGREMAYQMALPKKSVSGLAVVECTEFGREIISMDGEYNGSLPLGNIYHMQDIEKNIPVKLEAENLKSHTFITGSTGSGKSTTVYKILDEISKKRIKNGNNKIKFMVIEPAKGEYKNVLGLRKDVSVYGTNPRLTELLKINPFSFPTKEIHIHEHLDRLVEIFNVCWPMYAAMPAVLKAAMENAYRAAGWNLLKSENQYGDIFPSFSDVAIEVEKYINRSEYSDENKSNYKGSLLTRLESLTNGINGMIFSANAIKDEELFDENVIIDLSRVGSTETKSLIMGILVLKLQEYRMANASDINSSLKHITVLEEAHNLLKRTSTEQISEGSNLLGKSVEMLSNSIAEMRTYGEGFIIADQSPGLLDMSVIRNTNTKIIMRLPDYSDRELVGKAANLNQDQITELAKLPCGVAAVYQSEWINPVLCKVKPPKIESTNKPEYFPLPITDSDSPVFKMLDSDFASKLDNPDYELEFKNSVLRANIPTNIKIKVIDYLENRKSNRAFDLLSSLVYDYFSNAEKTVEEFLTSGEALDIDTIRQHIMVTLEPSLFECNNEQIDVASALIVKEYIERNGIELPGFGDIAEKFARGEIK